MAPHSSTLAWKIPWTEEPGRLQSMGLRRVGHDWVTSLSLFTFMHWKRKWQPTPVFLPGESQGRGSLVGCPLWGHIESDMTEATQQQQHDPSKVGWGPFLSFFFKSIFLIFKWCWRVSRKKKFPLLFQVLLAGLRIKLAGYSPEGRKESDTTGRLHFHFSLTCIGEGILQYSCLGNPRDRGAWWAAVYGVT